MKYSTFLIYTFYRSWGLNVKKWVVDYGCSHSALKYVNKDPDLNFKVSNNFYTVLIQKKKTPLHWFRFWYATVDK